MKTTSNTATSKEKPSWNAADLCDNKSSPKCSIREREEIAKKALLLKKKELKWKLMQASQTQNRAKLEEIRTEVNYHKQKFTKAKDLAAKLRAKYLKVVKTAKLTELQYKKSEAKLLTQEKFVADEKMQLTKLAVDCRKMGNQLYGSEYRLTTKKDIPTGKTRLSSLYDPGDSILRSLHSSSLKKALEATETDQSEMNLDCT